MFRRVLHALFVTHGRCPCGADIKIGVTTGEVWCSSCNRRVIIRNGKPVGRK
ncbi:MAG: hypothetical protein IJ305_02920 [Oscillospiraceae bacterium]|nr:hypothetical protein [Oscillospiraceae bacterium]